MEIKIAQRLKELRRLRGNTQEELARHLGVSVQAVSKWERGEGWPDLSLLPGIAFYYHVTVDTLLGVEQEDKKRREAEISDQYLALRHQTDEGGLPDVGYKIEEGIALLRDGVRELPDSGYLGQLLASDLWWYAENAAFEDERPVLLREARELCRRVLSGCGEERWRHAASQILCLVLYAEGDREEARRMAADMPDVTGTDVFMMTYLLEGEELRKQLRFAVHRLLSTCYRCVTRLIDEGWPYDPYPDEAVQIAFLASKLPTQDSIPD